MKKLKTWFLFISLILLIFFRFLATLSIYKNDDKVRITTTILTEPIKYETYQYLKIAGLKVYLPLFPEISYGDKIVIEGIIENKKLEKPRLEKLQTGNQNFLRLRSRLIAFYRSVLPEPYAGLTVGITLGSKGGLSPGFWEKVKNTGVAHVVVASGMNVTFVSSFLFAIASVWSTRRKSIIFVVLGVALYVIMVGLEAPIVRAAVMGIIAFLAQELGRLVSAWRALVLSALAMLLVNPFWIEDLGFILSFVATASILVFEAKIRSKLFFVPKFLKEGLSTSLSAQIGVTPILFVTFGQFNILSPVINALILWTVPLIMVIASVSGIIGVVFEPLGKLVLYLAYPLLWWFVSIVTFFSF